MRKKAILITGAAGEIGQALIENLSASGDYTLLTIDLHPLPEELNGRSDHMIGDILDQKLFARLVTEYDIDSIFHLAALLSTRAEFNPPQAHRVNVEGTLRLLEMAISEGSSRGTPSPSRETPGSDAGAASVGSRGSTGAVASAGTSVPGW